jgi:hypothetical protein
MKMRIVAIDPGSTTGWASMDAPSLNNANDRRWRQGMMGPEDHHLKLYTMISLFEPDIVICEGFEYRNDSREGLVLDSREYIGVAKLWAQERTNVHVRYVEQQPNVGKIRGAATEQSALVKKRNLQKLGLWSLGPKSEHHMVDATGHLLYFMLTDSDERLQWHKRDLLIRGGWK